MEINGPALVKSKFLLFFYLFCFFAEILGDTKVGTIDLKRHKRNPQNDQHPVTTSNGGYFDINAFRQNGTFEVIKKKTKNPVDGTGTATRRDDESLNTQCTTPRKGVTVGAQAEHECSKYYTNFQPAPIFHIIGGKLAKPGQYPYIVALGGPLITDSNQLHWYCGGSLITDQWVLTAAHCIKEDSKIVVRLGTIYLNGTGGIDRTVKRVIKHHDYVTTYFYNDIALLELDQPVPIDVSSGIRPICLHTSQSDIDTGTNVQIAGWGRLESKSSRRSTELLHAEILTVDADSCNASFIDYYKAFLNISRIPQGIQNGQLCATDTMQYVDTCEGDSGGPLQHSNHNAVPILHGVTSFGILCVSTIPGVYARVSHYLDWIECIIWG